MWVCSGVRTVLFTEPSALTSLKSSAHAALVSACGPSVRNCEELRIRNGRTPPTHGVGSSIGVPSGLCSGCQCPGSELGTHCDGPNRPSFCREAIIASAAASPAAMPEVLDCVSGIPASEAAYSVASESCRLARFGNGMVAGTVATTLDKTGSAAVATAASFEAVESNLVASRYGRCRGSIALTASYTAPWAIAMLICRAGGAPPATGGIATSVPAAIRIHFVTSLACADAGAAGAAPPAIAAHGTRPTNAASGTTGTNEAIRLRVMFPPQWAPRGPSGSPRTNRGVATAVPPRRLGRGKAADSSLWARRCGGHTRFSVSSVRRHLATRAAVKASIRFCSGSHRSTLTVMDRELALPDRLLRGMLDVVEEARRDDTGDVPPRSMIRGLAKLVPGLNCAFGELEPTRRYVILQDTDEDYYGVGVDTDAALGIEPDPTWRLMRQHPNCRYLRTTGRTEVVQFSDFVTARQFHALEIYQRVFRLAGIEHMISVPLPAPPGRSRGVAIVRQRGSGFSETEPECPTIA